MPRIQDTTQAVYRTAVAAHLRQEGIEIEDAAVSLDQVLRVDLDGEGTMEALVVSHRARGSATSARAGDHGLVLLRTVADGAMRQRAVEAAGYYREACLGECVPATYRVAAVLDANGDGTMEVVTATSYFEGRGGRLYTVDDAPPRVLSWRCGA